jgi:subtilisin family serine protease
MMKGVGCGAVALALLALCGSSLGQTGTTDTGATKLWVYFMDKGVSPEQLPAALAAVQAGYDAHAVERRRLRRTDPGLFDERDLPIAGAYRGAVEATGASVSVESRWLNAVSVKATAKQAAALGRLACVRSLEPVAFGRCDDLCQELVPLATPPYTGRDFYGYASDQLTQINLIALHARGFHGAGVRVGILDTGFRQDHLALHSAEFPLTIIAQHDFINNDDNTDLEPGDDPAQIQHGTLILGTLAAYEPDVYVGSAYEASFILCKTEVVATETPIEEDYYVAGLEYIEAHGGDMATSSLGYIDWYTQSQLDGHTAVTTVAVNTATANGVHCCTAAGNNGNDTDPTTNHLLAPGDALQVITCGAADSTGAATWFSSDGPSADGRVKPEVLARGLDTATITYADNSSFGTASGTSLSTPLVAGAVACLISAHPDWTPDQMRRALFSTASDAATGPDPLFIRGYGIINADRAASHCLSDYNGDGSIGTDADIEAFFACLSGSCCPGCGSADFNLDGSVGTDADIEAFFRVLSGGPCQ